MPAVTDNTLGGRLPLLAPDDLTHDQKKLYNKLDDTLVQWAKKSGFQAKTDDDKLIGPFNPMLRSPQVSLGMLELLDAETKHTTLSEKVRQVIILTVGGVWQAAYELYAHAAVGRKAGLDEPTIAALDAGQTPATLAPDEHTAHEFTRHLTAEYRVPEDVYQQALATFGEEGVVNMIYLAGNYMSTCALLNAFAVPAPKE
ncbi:carboxymuconolactone decarboxylase family protein [Hymenobacter sp. RP-2-7]|uniref:Carboxymuconolactone decarboxylase family protein n=1 Tax=Hymenobacter polaris TaxID=2682546 RepID=A0A7Y0AIJ5_9BACT|nr:carboxymuconolactone decarboxylase family protein [Hymenobacter polaris]NML68016.1 carboxymuconolactone decarboxylase family protein [Hymenobacter polaris]